MFEKIKTYLKYGNQFCGIEQSLDENGDNRFYVSLLKKQKNQLTIKESFGTDTIEKISPKIPKKQHCFLILNNTQVLTKTTDTQSDFQLSNLINNVFPNINLDDFYCEAIVQEKKAFVSICRKSYVDNLISKFNDAQIKIVNISLGNNIVSSIANFIDQKATSSNASISVNKGVIEAIEKEPHIENTIYDINGLSTNNYNLLSVSGAISIIIKNFNPVTNFESLTLNLYKNFIQLRFFDVFFKTSLVTILSILIINFFAFNFYYDQVNNLKQASIVNKSSKQNLIKTKNLVEKSQKMVDDMLKSKSSKSSFFINKVIQDIPKSVLLKELNFQPLLKRIKDDKPIINDLNVITISGESNNSIYFSKWLTELEGLNWVNKVDIISYEDVSSTKSIFNLKLNIINE